MGRVVNYIADIQKESIAEELKFATPKTTKPKVKDSVIVMGLKGIATATAKCCNPMPGDEIIGYITRGRGATIHRKDCPNILRVKEKERLINVDWGIEEETYPITVQVKAYDRQGLMSDISTVITNEGIRLLDLSMNMSQHLVNVNLKVEVSGITQLSRLLTRLENLPNVIEASRSRPG